MASLHQAVEYCDIKKVEELLSSGEYQVNCTDSEGRTPLHIACGKGHFDLVRVLGRYGADFTARDKYKHTPLTLAARNSKYDCVLSIIKEFNCSVNNRGAYDRTLLHYACGDGNIDLVHILVRNCKADLNIKNFYGDKPIMTATKKNQCEVVKALVCDYGCDPNVKMNCGSAPLHVACANGYIDLVHVLVRDCKADLNIEDFSGDKPIVRAAKKNHCEVVKALVCDYGCDPNVKMKSGSTSLHIACANGDIDLVHVLVRDCKANLNIENDAGDKPIVIAAKYNRCEVVKALVCDYGCDPNLKMKSGSILIHIACAKGYIDLVHVLVRDCKANLNIVDLSDNKPIVIAAENNQREVVKALVCDYGCDPTVINQYVSTELLYACCKGDIDSVHVFVRDCKADLKIKDRDGRTPLMIAAKRNHYEVVKALVCDYGCDPNVNMKSGTTLLHIACANGDINLVHVLVRDRKADLNIENVSGDKPIVIAAKYNQCEVVKALVCDYGCDPTVINQYVSTRLLDACYKGDIDSVHVFVRDCKADLKIKDYYGKTPLIIAANRNHYEVVKALVCDYGCDPNVKMKSGRTLLHIACANGDIDLVHVLVRDCKADLNIENISGDKPIVTAVKNNQCEVVKALVCDYGCDPNAKNNDGSTLLHIACANGYVDLVHVLVRDCKADLNHKDFFGDKPIVIAVKNNQCEVVKALVCDYGCDPNCETLLHTACSQGNIDIVHVLLRDCKADLNIRDDHYDTPLMKAVKCNKCEIVKTLISEYKCDVSITDSNGRSLLHMAGGVEVLNLLLVEYKMSSLLADNDGNTPLHLFSSGYTHFCVNSVSALLFKCKAPIYILNKEGKSPRDLVRYDQIRSVFTKYLAEYGEEIQVDYKSMQLLAAKRYSGSNLICRLFVVGHPGAGKSSLVETLKREGFFESYFYWVSVPPHTAGIVPSIHISDSYGRVQFYDFAGDPEYYSSHAAILERLFQSNIGTNIYIIVFNLLEDDVEIEEKYLFWLSFINYSFKRLEESPSVVVIGSHSDRLPNKREVIRKNSYIQDLVSIKYRKKKECVSLSLNCCNPRSSNIRLLRQTIHDMSKKSQPYSLSLEESILLGLLEKDFSNVTACTAQTITSHIEELNLGLPRSVSLLYPILQQLQAIGMLLLVGGEELECYIVLNVAQLTNEVHKRLFSQDAFSINQSLASFNIGLLPQPLLQEVLPKYITKECLIQLQYCQEVAHIEISSDHSVSPNLICPDITTLPVKSYLFFPALCRLDKKDISWQTPTEHSYSIGWLARCHDPHDYFPPRFLHVLLLRIALRFTLIAYDKASPDHQQLKRRCKMWKTGVHWLSEEGVECEVDVIGSKEVTVFLKSAEESKMCLSALNSIVSCVMEAKAEFCDFIVLDFFLLDKVSCLTDDNLFHVEDVERVLREGKPKVISMDGKKFLSISKLVHISCSFWSHLFPIDEHSVLKYIETIVTEWFDLGLNLDLSSPVLKSIETNYPRDVKRCKTEMVIIWLNSSLPHPPCWWCLVKALRETEKTACADRITEDKGEHIALQKKLLNSQDSHLTPDEEFLESFAGVVGCKWPYLASLLSLTSSTIEEVRSEGEDLTQRERALLMLCCWISVFKEEATYSQLYQKLKPISLFQYCNN